MPYVELHAKSAFSFLDGASIPEALAGVCAERGLPAMALLDRDGVYGAPRFHHAAKKTGIRALIGSEVTVREKQNPPQRHRGTEIVSQRSQRTSVSPCLRGGFPSIAIRIFRPALSAQVTVRDQQPVRVACEGDGSRAAISGEITWASGPWRSSGDWWTQAAAPNREPSETRYTREEWDIAIATAEGDTLCRLVHDLEEGSWLLEGIYD